MPRLRTLLALSLLCAAAVAGVVCGETVEYSSGFLVTVRSEVAVDCIVLAAENPSSGASVQQAQDAAEWRSGFREETLKVLVYPTGKLAGPTVRFRASGRRGSCDGQDGREVARAETEALTFQRQVVKVEVVLRPLTVDADHDGWLVLEDCDDTRSDSYPGAAELCDDRDNDCDFSVDEGCGCSADRPCWPADRDPATRGVGACVEGVQRCVGSVWDACTDAGAPSAETCDLVDQDCDGATDEGPICGGDVCRGGLCVPDRETVCSGGADEDNDTLADCADLLDCTGLPCGGQQSCCGGACVAETACADGVDNDCDGLTDCAEPACDGLACDAQSRVCATLACRCPSGEGATELCNGVDEDCDGVTDDGFGAVVGQVCSRGLGRCQRSGTIVCKSPTSADCSTEAASLDAVSELCANEIDDDCDGLTDCADPACADRACASDANVCTSDMCVGTVCVHGSLAGTCCGGGLRCNGEVCENAPLEICTGGADEDCDGMTDCADSDSPSASGCANACLGPLQKCSGGVPVNVAQETACADGVDNDCDSATDCADPSCETPTRRACSGDGKTCTLDRCGSGTCQHENLPAGTCCGSSQVCAGDTCGAATPEIRAACDGGTDEDCDGTTDCKDTSCDNSCVTIASTNGKGCFGGNLVTHAQNDESGTTKCNDGVDNDCDGLTDCADGLYCNSAALVEICDNGVEDDCESPPDIDCADSFECGSGAWCDQSGGVCCNGACCASGICCVVAGTCVTKPFGRDSCTKCLNEVCDADTECCQGNCKDPGPGQKRCLN